MPLSFALERTKYIFRLLEEFYEKACEFAINITADGYCSHTDMIADEQIHKYFTEVLRNANLLLFGRITYQLWFPIGQMPQRSNR